MIWPLWPKSLAYAAPRSYNKLLLFWVQLILCSPHVFALGSLSLSLQSNISNTYLVKNQMSFLFCFVLFCFLKSWRGIAHTHTFDGGVYRQTDTFSWGQSQSWSADAVSHSLRQQSSGTNALRGFSLFSLSALLSRRFRFFSFFLSIFLAETHHIIVVWQVFDLLGKCLCPSPYGRITAAQALQHPFLCPLRDRQAPFN